MRKLIGILSLFAILALCACTQNSQSSAPAEVPAAVEVQYVEHVCSDKCTAEGCYHAHGEKDHVCDESCPTEL